MNEEQRELNITNRTLLSEVEKFVRFIFTLGKIGLFVFKVLDPENKQLDFSALGDDLDIYESQTFGREMDEIVEEVLSLYTEEHPLIKSQSILRQPNMVMNALSTIEEEILKGIEVDELVLKDIQKSKRENNLVLADFESKRDILMQQLEDLKDQEAVLP